MRVGGQPHAPVASTPEKDPLSIAQEAGWAPGPVWTGGKPRPHRYLIPDLPARSQSLYQLSYPAHSNVITNRNNSVTKCNVAGAGQRGASGLYGIPIVYSPVCKDLNAPQCCVVCEFPILLYRILKNKPCNEM